MNCFRSTIATVLLALWVPAILHCAIDIADLNSADSDCCSHGERGEQPVPDAQHCTADHCSIFDDGQIRASLEQQIFLPPDLCRWAIAEIVVPRMTEAQLDVRMWSDMEPPHLAAPWQFVMRAAAMPRAPGLTS